MKRTRVKFVKKDDDQMTDQEFQAWVDKVLSKPKNVRNIINGTYNKD